MDLILFVNYNVLTDKHDPSKLVFSIRLSIFSICRVLVY